MYEYIVEKLIFQPGAFSYYRLLYVDGFQGSIWIYNIFLLLSLQVI